MNNPRNKKPEYWLTINEVVLPITEVQYDQLNKTLGPGEMSTPELHYAELSYNFSKI